MCVILSSRKEVDDRFVCFCPVQGVSEGFYTS